jgi:hypothetical protein
MTQRLKAKVKQVDRIVAQTVKIGSGLKLGDLSDVDVTGQSDGVMMIFDGTTGTYKVTTQIENENLNIIGGTY